MLEIGIFLFGLILGSFINVCIYRLPRGESVAYPASHCPVCQTAIRAHQNIPVISFILLGGRCGTCGIQISWKYPLVEALHGVAFLFIFQQFGPTLNTLIYCLFFAALVAVTFIDLSHRIVPDQITLPGMVIGVVCASTVLPPGMLSSLIGLFAGGGIFYLVAVLSLAILKKEGMGGGDIKLIAMIGAFLGWKGMLLTIFLAACSGSFIGILLILAQGRDRAEPIPFGPFLALGAVVALFWEKNILDWYFSIGRM